MVGQTMWQKTPFMVHPSWFWWSLNGSTSRELFLNLKYLEKIYFRTIKVGVGGGGGGGCGFFKSCVLGGFWMCFFNFLGVCC